MNDIYLFGCFVYFSTFVCPTEIIAFSDRIQEFKNINTESTFA
jgi:alkyl hydroperoxide reductase subunit AhpC